MLNNPLTSDFFEGQISVEINAEGLKPWRLPHLQQALFPSPNNSLLARAENASGVRLRFATSATTLMLNCLPLPQIAPGGGRDAFYFDITINGELTTSVPVAPGATEVRFDRLPDGIKIIELWLPQEIPVSVQTLLSSPDCPCTPIADDRPRWLTYGSSLTHCTRAHSPARIWPAIVARRHNLNLTSLGFGGECHLDAMFGRVIASKSADFITLKLGINCINGSLGPRTFAPAVLGLVHTIRDQQADTPIGLISPIAYPPHETQPNLVGYTIEAMRNDIKEMHQRLTAAGDTKLFYFDGLDIFDTALIEQYSTDQCHPNGDGIERMADRFDRVVMTSLLTS